MSFEVKTFFELREAIVRLGYGAEIVWQESVKEPDSSDEFMWQYIWVVISSGMKNQIARKIEQRIAEAYNNHQPIEGAFKHKGKVKAIEFMVKNHEQVFDQYLESKDRLSFLQTLPYIGEITKYHLAKNLGEDVVKPDRHLVRIAQNYGTTPLELCQELARKIGYRIGTIDLILWRAANLGFI